MSFWHNVSLLLQLQLQLLLIVVVVVFFAPSYPSFKYRSTVRKDTSDTPSRERYIYGTVDDVVERRDVVVDASLTGVDREKGLRWHPDSMVVFFLRHA